MMTQIKSDNPIREHIYNLPFLQFLPLRLKNAWAYEWLFVFGRRHQIRALLPFGAEELSTKTRNLLLCGSLSVHRYLFNYNVVLSLEEFTVLSASQKESGILLEFDNGVVSAKPLSWASQAHTLCI